MPSILNSKKLLAFAVGVTAVTVLAAAGTDLEVLMWVGGFISSMVAALCFSQGYADGLSKGKTSAKGL